LPSDVYFYPIGDKWIWGGSRQEGILNKKGCWEGLEYYQTTKIDNIDIPKPIIELNKEILNHSFGFDIQSTEDIRAFIGYRYSRKHTKHGLRIEAEERYGKNIIHNYGHGGAGVTLSWGCALKVLHLIDKITNRINLQERVSELKFSLRNLQPEYIYNTLDKHYKALV
jgi:hypothetical protein